MDVYDLHAYFLYFDGFYSMCILIDFMMIQREYINLITNRVPISPDLHGM